MIGGFRLQVDSSFSLGARSGRLLLRHLGPCPEPTKPGVKRELLRTRCGRTFIGYEQQGGMPAGLFAFVSQAHGLTLSLSFHVFSLSTQADTVREVGCRPLFSERFHCNCRNFRLSVTLFTVCSVRRQPSVCFL